MITEIISVKDQTAFQHAVDIFDQGGLVAFPTDTVYGLGAPAFNVVSIDRLYVVKGRNHSKAIAVLLSDFDQLKLVTKKFSKTAMRLAQNFWPGPLTLIIPRHPSLPEILSPEQNIGVRIPDHQEALTLIEKSGPLAVTSANLSGQPSPVTAEEVYNHLNSKIHLIIDGGTTPGGIPSTVVDCTKLQVKLLREGPIDFSLIQSVLKH
jgi:L-threonylcarbamoyladenylate synthase